ncbi:MAG: heavy-metal-associated domain-containing protein [Bacteriovoracia bacterium]
METKTYRTNLNCGKCLATVTPFLNGENSIVSWELDIQDQRKPLTIRAEKVNDGAVRSAVEKAGFKVFEEIKPKSSSPVAASVPNAPSLKTYFPLILIFAYIASGVALLAYQTGDRETETLMRNFMGGFFLVFSFFKLLNVKAFAEAYQTYDVVAKAVPAYGFFYPFIELGLGIAYLGNFSPVVLNWITLAIMGVSTIGVAKALWKKNRIECACLGTVFKLPMTKVTLFEDLLMVAMATVMLLRHQ